MRAEILFPHKSVYALAGLREPKWRELAKRVSTLPEDHPDSLAFCLMMIRQCGCLDCNPDRYKALMGCAACAKRNVAGYKGTDDQLLKAYKQARSEIVKFLEAEELAQAA
ncbi:MAG: hypothetical protein BroJett039_13240 [Chloroflexota bacterium]|nr:MAG: hypothetical protein BroJett039_13240 [Chloroflexota bacterium]